MTIPGKIYKSTLALALLLIMSSCGGGGQEIKSEGDKSAVSPFARSISILQELDKALLLEMSEGSKKVEIEYRTFGGISPDAKAYFIRFANLTDNDKAWKKFKKLARKFPDDALGNLGQAYIYIRWKIYDKAIDKLDEAALMLPKGDPLFALIKGDLHFALGEYEKAMEQFGDVTEKMPGNLRVTIKIAKLYEKQEKIEEAIKLYTDAIKVNPGIFILQTELGDLLIKNKKPDDALAEYIKASEINKNDSPVMIKIGDIYNDKKDSENAIKSYEKAVNINPSAKGTLLKLDKLYTAKKDKEGEFSVLSRLIEINSNVTDYQLRIGGVAYELEKYDRAISGFEAAVKIEEGNAKAYWGLGRCYKKKNNNVKAVQNYLKALSLDATLAEAKKEYNGMKSEFNIGEPISASSPDAVYNKVVKRVKKIANDYLKKSGKGLKGEVEVEVLIDEKGKVTKLEFTKDTLKNEKIRASIFGNILEAKFPPKKQYVTLPFIFD